MPTGLVYSVSANGELFLRLAGQRIELLDLLRYWDRPVVYRMAKAHDLLGWQPQVDLQTGISRCAPWLQEQRLLAIRIEEASSPPRAAGPTRRAWYRYTSYPRSRGLAAAAPGPGTPWHPPSSCRSQGVVVKIRDTIKWDYRESATPPRPEVAAFSPRQRLVDVYYSRYE